MRNLYPINGNKPGILNKKIPDFVLTEKDYQALLQEISDIVEDLDRHKLSNLEFEEQLAQSIRSVTANFDNLSVSSSNIADLIAHELTVAIGNATTFTVDTLNVIVSAAIEAANIHRLISDNATISSASISSLTGNTASFDEITANTANLTTFNASTLESQNLEVDNATIGTENVTESSIGSATIDHASINEADITGVQADLVEAIKAEIYTLNAEFQVHNELTNVQYLNDYSVTDDFYAVVPIIYNGSAYLTAVDSSTHEILWTVEILNSMQNNLIRWGINESGAYLKEFEIVQPDNNSEFIQIHGIIDGHSVELYHYTNSFNNTSTIDIYTYKKYTGFKTFEITRSQGSYVPNATFAGEFHAESLVIDQTEFESIKVDKAIILPDKVDQYGQVEHSTDGNPYEYLMVKEDEHGNEYPTWQKPTDVVEEDNKLLIDSDTVAKYDGKIDNPDYDPTDPTSEEFKYPITNLGDNTTVHGNETVEGNIRTKHIYDGAQADMPADMPNQSLVIFDGTVPVRPTHTTSFDDTEYWEETGVVREYNCIKTCYATATSENPITRGWMGRDIESIWRTFVFDGTETYDLGPAGEDFDVYLSAPPTAGDKLTRKTRKNNQNKFDELAVYESTFDFTGKNNQPVIYDEANNSLKTSKDVTLGDVTMDELVINKDLHVKGDAFVEGTLHTVEEETITSTGDNLVLRQNNPSSLGNDTSGIIVNNYDGNGSSLELATTSDGTLKVGTGTPTTTTYLNIYKSRSDDKWYSDAALTTEVTPVGYLASWEAEDTTDDYIHYEHAIFADLSATLEPIMTRDEEVNLNDQGLLIWDTDDTEAKTIALPTNDEDSLVPTFVPDDPSEPTVGKWTYSWQPKKAGVYTFATMTDYETYAASHNVPDGSRIIIENEDTIVNSKEWPDHV
jgi:hypothetical protein